MATYKSPEVARDAVESLNQAKLEDATLSVEPLSRTPKRPVARGGIRGRGRGRGRGRASGREHSEITSRRPREDEGEEGTTAASDPAIEPKAEENVGEFATPDAEAQATQSSKPRNSHGSKSKAPKKAKAAQGVPSKTLLFVSHLSYSVRNEDLMELFSAYPAVSANIVYHRQHPKHSRGFAFVDFPNETAQQKALAENNGKEVHGRIIAVSGKSLTSLTPQWLCSRRCRNPRSRKTPIRQPPWRPGTGRPNAIDLR